jgi:hypothetical protein
MTLCAGFRCCDSPQRPTPGARKRVRSCACTDGMCVRSRENYVGVGYGYMKRTTNSSWVGIASSGERQDGRAGF